MRYYEAVRAKAIVAILSILVLAACSSDSDDDGRRGTPQTVDSTEVGVRLVARDQTSDGSSAVIDEVELATSGYVVAYADGNGAPGLQLGLSDLLATGAHEDVEIMLDPPVAESGPVYLIAHAEENGNETFDGNAADPPQNEQGNVLLVTIELTVEE